LRPLLLLFICSLGAVAQDSSTALALRPAVTEQDRLNWFTVNTVTPQNLFGQTFTAGWATLTNAPPEYGPHWEGFAKRYGMSMTGVVTSNLMEIGLGALWGENPAYPLATGQPIRQRLGRVFKFTFVTENRAGRTTPAYARYMAYVGNNFLSNAWRADGEASTADTTVRIGFAFLGRLSGNAFNEFWPDAKRLLHHIH
jgi:hypothetical protein